ncbi:MAG: hypothetical protein WC518_02440 [Patescibacteria group bacterium]
MKVLFKTGWLVGRRKWASRRRRSKAWKQLKRETNCLEGILRRMEMYHSLENWTSREGKDINNRMVLREAAAQLPKVASAEQQCRRVGVKEDELVAIGERRAQHWKMVSVVELSRAVNTAGL